MDLNRSSPSQVNPQRFGAGPAIYAHALSSVSFKKTCEKSRKKLRAVFIHNQMMFLKNMPVNPSIKMNFRHYLLKLQFRGRRAKNNRPVFVHIFRIPGRSHSAQVIKNTRLDLLLREVPNDTYLATNKYSRELTFTYEQIDEEN